MAANMPTTSADTGSGHVGVTLPGGQIAGEANVTLTHTVIVIVGALALLWLLGHFVFRGIRM